MRSRIVAILVLALLILALGFLWKVCLAPRKEIYPKVRVVAPAVKKEAALPQIIKRIKNPKVAIVMDDFGYNMNNVDDVLNMKYPITFSVLPNLRYSGEIAGIARANGYEVILHLPLEPHRKDVQQEVDTINSRMDKNEIIASLEKDLSSVPGAIGVSNHMGSKATEEEDLMTTILSHLKKQRLYFFDSLTSNKSVCEEVALRLKLRFAKREVFLDMGRSDAEYVRGQILELRRRAFRMGSAIAVCHDRKETVKVLAEMMPGLAREGVRFVFLSKLVR